MGEGESEWCEVLRGDVVTRLGVWGEERGQGGWYAGRRGQLGVWYGVREERAGLDACKDRGSAGRTHCVAEAEQQDRT